MKKLTLIIIIIYMLSSSVFSSPGYEAGVNGEAVNSLYEYKEVVALTGEPIIMTGTVKQSISKSASGAMTTLEYKLTNTAKGAKLDRKIVYIDKDSKNALGNQISHVSTIDPKFTETIQLGSDKYTLVNYQFNRSGLTDDRAVIKYLVSNWTGKKTYRKNSGEAEVIMDISSECYKYSNFWSTTETALINNMITYRYKPEPSAANFSEAFGTVKYAVSNSTLKNLEYASNQPKDISFRGGYIIKDYEENVVSYSYDLPAFDAGKPQNGRNKGKNSFKLTTVPKQSRTFVPSVRDVASSYWAAEDIMKLLSMDIISVSDSNYFRPLNFMSRGEFTKAIVKAANIENTAKTKNYDLLFDDVEKNHPYFSFIDTAVKTGIINGTSKRTFSPDDYLTKAQAVTIIVRAMGLEDASLESSDATPFADDSRIPSWAKKSINIAYGMGIIKGNENNEIEPGKMLTRAECAAMINRFIKYLQYDIKKEYREKIINFGF